MSNGSEVVVCVCVYAHVCKYRIRMRNESFGFRVGSEGNRNGKRAV